MQVEQISVFLENKSGRLSEVTAILSEAKVNIRALALADTSDFGVLRLIVDDTEKARQAPSARPTWWPSRWPIDPAVCTRS